jgi:D-glycero-alpha-D-manno-heptose-7-phosphate kinase
MDSIRDELRHKKNTKSKGNIANPHLTLFERKTRARAPLRLGLAGGGTDLSPYCDTYGGAILNATIDRYAYASVVGRHDGKIAFVSCDLGRSEVFDVDADLSRSTLDLHRGVYERMIREYNGGQRLALSITTTVDAPMGSGLGSSSALVVALVDAFRVVLGAPLGEYDVARLAFEIERVDLGIAGGRQDQYAASFGGVNFIEFLPSDRVIVNPLRVSGAILNELESSLVVCFSGQSRQSAEIIQRQTVGIKAASAHTMDALHKLKDDAVEMKQALLAGDILGVAKILNGSWMAKKASADGITTGRIDELFNHAMGNGAIGGKVSGAGGGGFIFFMVDPDRRFDLVESLRTKGAMADPVNFTATGCECWQV